MLSSFLTLAEAAEKGRARLDNVFIGVPVSQIEVYFGQTETCD